MAGNLDHIQAAAKTHHMCYREQFFFFPVLYIQPSLGTIGGKKQKSGALIHILICRGKQADDWRRKEKSK